VAALGAQPPLIGHATLTPQDAALLMKAGQARVGFFNQPRMLFYCALFALFAAVTAIRRYPGGVPELFLGIAVVLLVVAILAGRRTVQMVSAGYGRGQSREIVVDDDGVTVREPGMSHAQAWSRFERAVENADYLVLFAGPGIVVLPKRAFTPDDAALLRARIATKLPIGPLR
jgi:hypothetical protein